MASIKESISKGITTINLKTSNFMDETKYKTAIATKESEITQLKSIIGEKVFENRAAFSMDIIAEEIKGIEERLQSIEDLQNEISNLALKEKDILGGAKSTPKADIPADTKFCPACGAPNKMSYSFCEKCGTRL